MKRTPTLHPELGLTPRTMPWRWSQAINQDRLREKVETFEHSIGNKGFSAYNLESIPKYLAFELGGVHVALRERFHAVRPDWIDVASANIDAQYGHLREENQPLALAVGYDGFSDLRALSRDCGVRDLDELVEPMRTVQDVGERRWLRTSLNEAVAHGVQNLEATGTIELATVFRSNARYDAFCRWRKNRRSTKGPATIVSVFTPATYAYIHEFGHLVESAVWDVGTDAVEHVYAALSEAVFESRPHSNQQWLWNLLNYPTTSGEPGPNAGGVYRRTHTKKVAGPLVERALGKYAATDRSELFAEAFVALWGGTQDDVKRRLRIWQKAMVEVGVAKSRVKNRKHR